MTKRKPLLIVENDEEMQVLKKSLEDGHRMFNESKEFLQKQAEKSWNELVKSCWDDIEATLDKRNLLPDDYSDEKYTLTFSDGVLYLSDKDEKSELRRLLASLFE